ncbi:MAG: RDD family protein, partial [Planctomycetes bacterium]|nr:RDD family protein [Planctomycetota bacterium]
MNSHEHTSLQRHITIRTPENLELSYALAGAGTRAAAYLVDVATMVLILQVGGNLLQILILALPDITHQWAAALITLAGAVATSGYFIFFEWLMNGQTPGKRVIGIRVIKQGGYAMSFLDSLLRNLMRWVDFLPLFYGVGLISLVVAPRSQRLGDLVAGTLVVHQEPVQTESLVPDIPKPEGAALALPVDQVAAVPSPVIEACVEFFRMLPMLAGKPRQQLATELVDLIQRTSGLVAPRTQSAEAFLAAV